MALHPTLSTSPWLSARIRKNSCNSNADESRLAAFLVGYIAAAMRPRRTMRSGRLGLLGATPYLWTKARS